MTKPFPPPLQNKGYVPLRTYSFDTEDPQNGGVIYLRAWNAADSAAATAYGDSMTSTLGFVAALVDSLIANGSPRVVVTGDLNDYEDSPPLQALYAGGHLTSTWYTLPAEARYSYIFRGVSQVLDHVLVSPALAGWLQAFAPLHSNADFPYLPYTYQSSNVWHASDHDPVIGTFVYPAGEYGVYLPVLFRP